MAATEGLLDYSLKKTKTLCAISGLDLGNDKKNYKRKILYLFNLFWVVRDLSGGIGYIIHGIWIGKEFIELTHGAPCVFFSFLGIFKSLSIAFNGERLDELFTILRKLERKNIKEVGTEEEKIAREDVESLHCVVKVLNVWYTMLTIAFAVNPLGVTAYQYWKTRAVDLRLPFFILYPFDASDVRYWPIAYVHQVWSEIVAISWVRSVDYIFYICCTYIRIQFRLVEHRLEHILASRTEAPEFRKKYREVVVWHQELIHCTHVLEAIYTKSTLYNFISSSALICLTGFDVMMISDTLLVVSFVTFLAVNMFQIFFLCFFGDLVMRSSIQVGTGAYKSQWYLKDATYGKALLLIQIRSQKPCKFTAYGFADVTLSAFTKILSNAWSYFALLNTMLN